MDVHRQRQERHRPESRPPGQRTASITSITYPGGNAAAAAASRASNQYQFQLERASLVSAPVPDRGELRDADGTGREEQLLLDRDRRRRRRKVMQFLRKHIKHVIYVVKENRTFDQVLGDLTNGANGDPALTQFGQALTPNNHRLATEFVTLDNFMNPGDGSMDGWSWAMQGRVTNTETITQQINYAVGQPRPVLRVRRHEPQRAGQLRDGRRARRRGRRRPGPPTTATPRRRCPAAPRTC